MYAYIHNSWEENTQNMHMLSGAAALKNFSIRGYSNIPRKYWFFLKGIFG